MARAPLLWTLCLWGEFHHAVARPRQGPRGNAASILRASSSVSVIFAAAAFSSTWRTSDDLGIARTPGRRMRNASAIWRGVAPFAAAIWSSSFDDRKLWAPIGL